MTRQEFHRTVASHYDVMYRVALSITNDSDEACDIVQDTLLKLWSKRDRLDVVGNLQAYCIGALRHQCVDYFRSRRSYDPLGESDGRPECSVSHDANDDIEAKSTLELINRIVETLPDNQAIVVRMSCFTGFNNEEISQATGLSPANVRTLLSRGRKRIKELYIKNR